MMAEKKEHSTIQRRDMKLYISALLVGFLHIHAMDNAPREQQGLQLDVIARSSVEEIKRYSLGSLIGACLAQNVKNFSHEDHLIPGSIAVTCNTFKMLREIATLSSFMNDTMQVYSLQKNTLSVAMQQKLEWLFADYQTHYPVLMRYLKPLSTLMTPYICKACDKDINDLPWVVFMPCKACKNAYYCSPDCRQKDLWEHIILFH
jgi:MYND finger